jgi:hypothetical protein
MQSYRVETTVSEKGTLVIKDIPFSVGEHVEVIVREMELSSPGDSRYPLRGTPYEFHQPFDSVAECSQEL